MLSNRLTVSVIHLRLLQDGRILIQDVNHGQAVTLTHGIVIEIVSRGNLYTASTKFQIHIVIGNNRDAAIYQWHVDELTDQVLITLIFRVHSDSGITQHGFWTGSGNHDVVFTIGGFLTISQWITHVPQMPRFVFGDYFQLGNSGM